jgi:tetratricopeptide (TPR) repeat protein
LLALQPDNLERRADLAITQANIGRQLAARGDYAGALALYEPASRALRATATDPNDARVHWLVALTDSDVGAILFHLGRLQEAEPILIDCQATLDRLQKQGPSLRVEYALGQNGARLGILHSHLAQDPALSPAKRLAHWRQAVEWLKPAVASLANVDANVSLEAIDQKSVDDAIAALARAEAAIAAMAAS